MNNLDIFYVKDTKVIKEDELKENFKKLKKGDLKARDIIIKSNIRLVRHIAKQYSTEGYDFEDLVSIGIIGLIKAVDTFDIEKQIRFSTYSSRCISNEILMGIRKNNTNNIQKVNIEDTLSCDFEGNELKYLDILEDKNSDFVTKIIDNYLSKELLNIIDSLSEKEKELVMLYFGFDGNRYKQKEIAHMLGISQSYISRMISNILKKIKIRIIKEGSLDDFAKKFTR